MIWVLAIALGLVCLGWAGSYLRTRRFVDRLIATHQRQLLSNETESDKRLERVKRDGEQKKSDGKSKFLEDLLPALDALDAAVAAFDDPSMPLVKRSFVSTFAKHGVTRISPEPGDDFDPAQYEAIAVEDSERPKNGIVRCVRVGYQMGERVVRPALVVTSSGTIGTLGENE